MWIEYTNTNEDFKEAVQAHAAFRRNKPISTQSRDSSSTRKIVKGIGGWIITLILLVVLWFMEYGHPPARSQGLVDSSQDFTHDLRLMIEAACAGPLFVMAVTAWMFSLGRTPSVPFFVPTYAEGRWPSRALQIVAAASLAAWLGVMIDIGIHETAPDWWVQRGAVLLFAFLPWVLCFLFLGITGIFLKRFNSGSLWHCEASSRDPQRLEITEAGTTSITADTRCEYSWSHFVSYLESANLLLMYTRDLTMFMVPKRAFADESSFFEFCSLLQNYISSGRFLPRASGFPVAVLPLASIGESDQAK